MFLFQKSISSDIFHLMHLCVRRASSAVHASCFVKEKNVREFEFLYVRKMFSD